MEAGRLAELRRWAEANSNGSSADDVRAAARTALALLDDPGAVDAERVAEARRWAQRVADRGDRAEARSAARALLALTREVELPRRERRPHAPRRAAEPAEPRAPRAGPRRPRPTVGGLRSPRARRTGVIAAAACLGVALVVGAVAAAKAAFTPSLEASGPPAGAQLGAAAIDRLAFSVRASRSALAKEHWTLDGRDVTSRVRARGGELVYRPKDLREGRHTVEITAGDGFVLRAHRRFPFVVDLTPPRIRLAHAARAHAWRSLTLRGVAEPGAKVTADGRPARLDGDRFAITYRWPLPSRIDLVATDAAGNRSLTRVPVMIVPRRPAMPIRAVHVTPYGWADDSLRRGILALIAEHRINAVEIDLKDEAGLVGFNPPIPLAHRIGAARPVYDLGAVIRRLHARGIRVIGRIVCFRDPILAAAAWKEGNRDEVIQTPSHEPYSGYGGFTNFANPTVRRYNIDIAAAAARAGIDDVLYDYVRRPDGPISTMVFPGLHETPERSIAGFLRETRLALRPYGTFFGASVFGVAATRPTEVAQDIPQMARQVDYIAPMVYPSHWSPGEYNVANPNADPYDIVQRSLQDFERDADGSGARIVPWLQDFSLGVTYGPAEVRAQIDAARQDGIREFILWDAAVTYTADALDPNAPTSTHGLAKPVGSAPAQRSGTKRKTRSSATAKAATPVRSAGGPMPNELGLVPVIMHHEIRPDRVGPYDQTPDEFRTELEQLWSNGYWPVTAAALATGDLGSVPAGKTPVVLTFDDSTQFQFFYLPDGRIKPTTAIGVLLEFAHAHPGFKLAGTFYVLREPFAGVPRGPAMLRWLVRHGFELGDHTHDHIPLNTLDATGVQRELVLGARVITDAVRGYRIRTMALPLGAMPKPRTLALRGRWGGQSYRFAGVFLDGGNPAPSPYAKEFDPNAIPRIRSSHLPWNGAADFTWAFWQHELAKSASTRYVSDGDPKQITFPSRSENLLSPRFRRLARPY